VDSDPDAEERETELKAAAFLDALRRPAPAPDDGPAFVGTAVRRVLLVDHLDSFVHTLANYLRQTGAEVTTLRAGFDPADLAGFGADLVVLSPGPGRPADFAMAALIDAALDADLAVFGVCLGLQGLAERFGAELGTLDSPMHGKPSEVLVIGDGGAVLGGLPSRFRAGRYHSLFARRSTLPDELAVTAVSEDDVVMAIEHTTLPVAAVQFHPESIMTLDGAVGLRLVRNVVERLGR
jgi:anthranilate synthase